MKTLVKFKTMQEILLRNGGTFDKHGNLHVYGEHLSPTYFASLGQLREMEAGHSFPAWCIEKEYSNDSFGPHQALRHIVKNSDDDMITRIAKEGLEGKASLVIGRYLHNKEKTKEFA